MPQLGAFGVTSTNWWGGAVIRWLTLSPVNHAFVYIGAGKIVEAQPHGARISDVGLYPDAIWSEMPIDHTDRAVVCWIAMSLVGTPYGFLDILALAIACLTGKRTPKRIAERLSRPDRLICSQLVDEAYRKAGIHLFEDGLLPSEVTPGDLYDLIRGQRAVTG